MHLSLSNIDKDVPWKRMYCQDASRGLHGTSVQHVNPLPLSGDVISPLDANATDGVSQPFVCHAATTTSTGEET